MSKLWGAIEAGGTKFVCAIGTGPDDLRAEAVFPTTLPAETIGRCVDFFQSRQAELGRLAGVGIGSFGPIDPNPRSKKFGWITKTPKPDWSNTDLAGPIRDALNVPVAFDTDVNAAALGEHRWGAARGLENFIYLTVGTGIGGGGLMNGKLMHGLIHPEMGHIRLPHDKERDPYPGHCPFHQDCLEGLASGTAMRARWNQSADQLPVDHPAWEMEAHYLALALVNFICALSPERIILGGGVMRQTRLFPLLRDKTRRLLAGYVDHPALNEEIDAYIVPPGLGNRSGAVGGIALAERNSNTPT